MDKDRILATDEEGESKDWINELPDCILVSIFSLLTLKDVVGNTMVSRQWRHLGLQPILTRVNLEFDLANIFGINVRDDDFEDDLYAEDFSKQDFVRCVNKVLQLHHGNKVDSFKVEFFFNRESTTILDEWIRFAITKGAQVLDLHLYSCTYSLPDIEERETFYDFPCWLLSELNPSPLKNLSLARCLLRPPPDFDRFNQLTTLYLYKAVVDNISLARLFSCSDCLLLESLTLDSCMGATDLIVRGPSLRLNDLRVVNCSDIERVDISLVKLANLELVNGRPNLHLSIKPPHPARIYYDPLDSNDFRDTLTQFGSFLGLETLGMVVATGQIPQNLPMFRDLKKLDLHLFNGADLVGLLNLLNAAPRLEELVVTLLVDNFSENQQQTESFSRLKHDHLRKVKLQAFRSTPCEIEFVISILQITTKLEIMEIDPFGKLYMGGGAWWDVLGVNVPYLSNSYWEEKGRSLVQEKLKEVKTDAQIIIL
ncbi:unnamed protein product [Prunus brigantina]